MHTNNIVTIPTEPIGSIPPPFALLKTIESFKAGQISQQILECHYNEAIQDTIKRFQTAGCPVIRDGEQRKYPNF